MRRIDDRSHNFTQLLSLVREPLPLFELGDDHGACHVGIDVRHLAAGLGLGLIRGGFLSAHVVVVDLVSDACVDVCVVVVDLVNDARVDVCVDHPSVILLGLSFLLGIDDELLDRPELLLISRVLVGVIPGVGVRPLGFILVSVDTAQCFLNLS